MPGNSIAETGHVSLRNAQSPDYYQTQGFYTSKPLQVEGDRVVIHLRATGNSAVPKGRLTISENIVLVSNRLCI